MESLIKQKMYSNAIELYNETKDDKDKRLFINYTVSDKELRNYLVQYIVSQNNLLILNMFLTKIFTLIKNNRFITIFYLYLLFITELRQMLDIKLPINKDLLNRNISDNAWIHSERIRRKL